LFWFQTAETVYKVHVFPRRNCIEKQKQANETFEEKQRQNRSAFSCFLSSLWNLSLCGHAVGKIPKILTCLQLPFEN
jgi:hypothetical protein